MKRTLTILFVLLAGFASAQETPPTGLKAVNSQYYINLVDSAIWQNKGTPYGWHRVAKYKELVAGLLTKADKTYVDGLLATKVDKVVGKQLSTEDYTSSEKTKLGGIPAGAEVNVNADWNAVSGDAQILNKPTIISVESDPIFTAQKGAVNGVATLNGSGKIPGSQIPALALVDTYVTDSQAAMLALSSAEQGDVAIRTDLSKTYILTDANYSTLSSWKELLSPVIPNETDPIWGASASAGITSGNISSWNAKQVALSGTGFVKISGNTISYDNSNYLTTTGTAANSTLWGGAAYGGPYAALSGAAFTGGITGTSIGLTGGITLENGQFYKAKREDGAVINVLGFEAGTGNLITIGNGTWKLRNTGAGDAANLLTVDNSGKAVLTGSLTAPSAILTAAPTTSASTYDILTRNSSTGTLEKIASTSLPNLSSGTYVPTVSPSATVSSGTGYAAIYKRQGNYVTVSGYCDITINAVVGNGSGFWLSLPIASNLANQLDLYGLGVCHNISGGIAMAGTSIADATNDRASITFVNPGIGTYTYHFEFTYKIN